MPGAVLRVSGAKVNVRRFLEDTTLAPSTVYWKGQLRFKSSKKPSLSNGFNISVSEASGDELQRQVRDAKRFLLKHVKDIRRMRRLRLNAVLDFGVNAEQSEGALFCRFDGALVSALAVAGISLEVSFYGALGPER